MWDFIINAILWTLALYGLFEIIKTIIYLYCFSKVKKKKDTYIVVALNGSEESIEGFLRSIIYRVLYEDENYVDGILLVDFGIKKETRDIIERFQKDYDCIRLVGFDELKKILVE